MDLCAYPWHPRWQFHFLVRCTWTTLNAFDILHDNSSHSAWLIQHLGAPLCLSARADGCRCRTASNCPLPCSQWSGGALSGVALHCGRCPGGFIKISLLHGSAATFFVAAWADKSAFLFAKMVPIARGDIWLGAAFAPSSTICRRGSPRPWFPCLRMGPAPLGPPCASSTGAMRATAPLATVEGVRGSFNSAASAIAISKAVLLAEKSFHFPKAPAQWWQKTMPRPTRRSDALAPLLVGCHFRMKRPLSRSRGGSAPYGFRWLLVEAGFTVGVQHLGCHRVIPVQLGLAGCLRERPRRRNRLRRFLFFFVPPFFRGLPL